MTALGTQTINAVRVGDEIMVPSIDAAKFCIRCGAATHPTDPAHLCPDVKAGLREQIEADFREYQRELVVYGGEA